jgi:hypothetical protein
MVLDYLNTLSNVTFLAGDGDDDDDDYSLRWFK